MESYGEFVRENRNRLGLSREEVAHQAGISATYVAKIEQGTKQPSPKVRVRLERILSPNESIRNFHVGDIIKIEGISFRIHDLVLSAVNPPKTVLHSLIEEMEK